MIPDFCRQASNQTFEAITNFIASAVTDDIGNMTYGECHFPLLFIEFDTFYTIRIACGHLYGFHLAF